MNLIRNQVAIMNELEKLKNENMKIMQNTFDKMSNKLIKLDSEFMRPYGFSEDIADMQASEVESLEETLAGLHSQIEGLRREVDTLA